jgi:hypothetical protein
MNKLALIEELIVAINKLQYKDWNALDMLQKRAEMIFNNISPRSNYIKKMNDISFSPMIYIDDDESLDIESWNSGKNSLLNLFSTIKEEIELFDTSAIKEEPIKQPVSNNIFIVHGHDDAMKLDVAGFLKQLDLKPIILHEQPDRGRNVLDKLIEESSSACFAVILLSPDDYGYATKLDASEKKLRARQNVVLELGYFIGKLKKKMY